MISFLSLSASLAAALPKQVTRRSRGRRCDGARTSVVAFEIEPADWPYDGGPLHSFGTSGEESAPGVACEDWKAAPRIASIPTPGKPGSTDQGRPSFASPSIKDQAVYVVPPAILTSSIDVNHSQRLYNPGDLGH
ncbi:hypothetical protein EJB05_51762 [Eragrostis curvula]|uniref:Uncharacterized protein n=1 Tax=Eragrostis curvula TaxID=38414 RepID=A0A5J9SUR6_9POAL|nr:hypothetical protein EJB05_51762 [Eragrostis curvula]